MCLSAGASLKDAGCYLQAAVLVGLLNSQSQNGLNLVSAPALAKEIGIQVGTATDWLKHMQLFRYLHLVAEKGCSIEIETSHVLQVATEHRAEAPKGLSELVSLSIQQPGGATYVLSGLVGANKPVWGAINGAAFTQGVALEGDLLLYRSAADLKVLSAVTSESPCTKEGSER